MTPITRSFALSATALAATLMLAACGGSDADPPADLTPPTATIADSEAGASAGGDVTFTFSFSESVGSSFAATDIVVTGGTPGSFALAPDGLTATLVVAPPPNASGTLTVSVAAGAFSDVAGNASAVALTASQDFSTVVAAGPSGSTGTCAAPACTDFAGAGIGFSPFENGGGGTVAIAADPNDAANAVVAFVKKPGDGDYFGTVITGLPSPTVLTADQRTVTLRVLSPAVGTNYLLKFEGGTGGPAATEKDAVATVAGAWETLSFVMPDTGTYSTVVLFPHGRSPVTADTTLYIDELKLPATVAPPPPTSGRTAPSCIDFAAAGIGFGPFENGGGGTVAIAADPVDAANKVARFVKKAGDGDYFGTTITGLGASVVLTPTARTVTMRVYSPAAGKNMLLKFEGGTGGPATTEVDVVTTQTQAWETLSFVLPDAGTYTTIVLFPNGRSQVSADTTFYVDDIRFPATSASGGGGGGGFAGGVFAADYLGELFVNARTALGGDVGFFFDPRLVATKAYDYAGLSGTAQNPGGVPNFYFGFGLNAPALVDAYFGAFVKAPGNGVVDASGFTNLKLNVWGPDQLFRTGNFPVLKAVLQGPAVEGCSSSSGGSELVASFATTSQGAAAVYTLPLAGFTIAKACSGETTVAQVLARLAQINIVLEGTAIQYVTKDPDGVAFTNGLNVGAITFD